MAVGRVSTNDKRAFYVLALLHAGFCLLTIFKVGVRDKKVVL